MSLYTLKTNEIIPFNLLPQGLRIEESMDIDLLALMGTTTREQVIKRLANDHVAYISYIRNIPAAFGWMARGKALIGELDHELVLPTGNRYLWNFRTLENFRGRGIYPALLHYIIRSEKSRANRFWIIHAPENNSSLRGIKKAGFKHVGTLYDRDGITTIENTPIARKSMRLLGEMGITISNETPSSCWNCSSPYLKKRNIECCCSGASKECVGRDELVLAS